ncbi:MAG: hypothetical protein CW338_10275 [Clostridiales bacterium]|nr:hypothetical protein [Clostridiales bacterium]
MNRVARVCQSISFSSCSVGGVMISAMTAAASDTNSMASFLTYASTFFNFVPLLRFSRKRRLLYTPRGGMNRLFTNFYALRVPGVPRRSGAPFSLLTCRLTDTKIDCEQPVASPAAGRPEHTSRTEREKKMRIETERLIITELTAGMAQAVHENSLDEDNRRFVPDEVFETLEEAEETVQFLMEQYASKEGPLVYAVLTKQGENTGYVQIAPVEEGREIGYHIAKKYTGKGYATEAVRAFLPVMADELGFSDIWGICLKENAASVRVLEKCGFRTVFTGTGPYQGEEREIVKALWKK